MIHPITTTTKTIVAAQRQDDGRFLCERRIGLAQHERDIVWSGSSVIDANPHILSLIDCTGDVLYVKSIMEQDNETDVEVKYFKVETSSVFTPCSEPIQAVDKDGVIRESQN